MRNDATVVADRAAIGKAMKASTEYEAIALELGAKAYLECSAREKVNIEEVIDKAVRVSRADALERAKREAEVRASRRKANSEAAASGGCCIIA